MLSLKLKELSALVVVTSLAVGACSDSPTSSNNPPPPPATIPPPATLNGVWSMTVKVTVATQACDGEAGDQSTEEISFAVTGSSAPYQVTASGFLGVPGNSLSGSMNAQGLIVIGGSYSEEDGTTTATHTLQRTSETEMAGTESWTWVQESGLGSCPGSASTVTATKI